MVTRSMRKRFLKFCLIWTVIAAVFTAAYSTGLYLLYEDGVRLLKDEIVLHSNRWYHNYHINNDKLMLHFPIEGNYSYFGKIEDDGSLTDVYKTDYDSFRVYSSDVMFPDSEYNKGKLIEKYLTTDADKQGKIVSSSYQIAGDEPSLQCYEQHYYACPEDVLDKIRSSQEKGTQLPKQLTPRDGLDYYNFMDYPDNALLNKIFRFLGEFSVFISDRLIHIFDDYTYENGIVEDASDGAYICRADVDPESRRIISGELKINGKKTAFPDNNLTDSDTEIQIFLHNRPDSIFENNKELLRDKFDTAYLENLKYQSASDLINAYNQYLINDSGLESLTCDYKYEDGQAVFSGICKYDDGYFRYVYIIPYAGFWETYAPWIAEPLVLVWLPGLLIGGLFSLVISRKRYV